MNTGDVVRLKGSSSPKMVVEGTVPIVVVSDVTCLYFVDSVFHRRDFPEACLELCEPESKTVLSSVDRKVYNEFTTS